MESKTHNTMSLEDFFKSGPYLALTEGQRKWVEIFIGTSDANRATREAYNATGDAYVAMFTRKIETSNKVLEALDVFCNRSPKERFIRDLQNDIAASKGIAKIEARKLFAKVTGLIDDAPETELAAQFKVGDCVRQDGSLYKVTAVDANGSILDALEIKE